MLHFWRPVVPEPIYGVALLYSKAFAERTLVLAEAQEQPDGHRDVVGWPFAGIIRKADPVVPVDQRNSTCREGLVDQDQGIG